MATKSSLLGLYESESASTWLNETVSGSHRFKVVGYSFDTWSGVELGDCVTSVSFAIGGYGFVMRYYPLWSKDFLAFTLELKRRKRGVNARITFNMHDPSGSSSTLSESVVHDFGSGWCLYSVERKAFETLNCLKDDIFEMMCTVAIVKQSRLELTNAELVMVPPSNLDRQLSHLFESGLGADVIFEVRGETFRCHKLILVARSPIFRAQFFGLMNDRGNM
ncbi:hypothetical protein LUZ60_002565 [Juncus effusus]|nr:hypothetical protein LUZ60_002565 [Juncus effusus]